MDDEQLRVGKEYWLKLGTRLVDAVVAKVVCAIDVNTGERHPVSVLGKNEIGQCQVELSEAIVADLFSNRKTLGEFILIDRVTHATSACGVIDKIWESGKKKGLGFNTRLLHFPAEAGTGATLPSIAQSSAFAYESAEKLEKVFQGRAPGFAYTRIGNPTVAAFENRIAAIEGAMSAVATSSGMAAISIALLNILQAGDELISASGLFGGTLELFRDFEKFGIKTIYVDTVTAEAVKKAATPRTKAVFAELIGNPKLDVVDVESVAKVCSELGIPLVIDSTTATPAIVRPLELGASVVVHSASKYISGQGNAISGVILDGGKFLWSEKFGALSEFLTFGKMAYTVRLRQDTWRNFGPCMAPENAFYGILGLETMGIRMERICGNASKLARALSKNPSVSSVNYPTLGEYSDTANRVLGGNGGGILTIRAGSKERAMKLINGLKLAKIATNIGDVRTLVIHPDSTIYLHCSKEGKENAGVFDDLIRISVGIEDPEDLIEDFRQAAEKLQV
jgi:O-acetylhomoserine (thiol)-lyase